MSKKAKLPTKKLKTLYQSVGLYDAFYNRSLGYKISEAGSFSRILEAEEKRPTSILELFANTGSRHKSFFELQYNYISEIQDYKCLDGLAPPSPDVISADAGNGDFGQTFDAVFAYYYAVSSAIDFDHPNGNITWEYMRKIFENVRKHLNPGGIFIIDSAIDGYRLALSSVTDREEETETVTIDIPLGHALREELKAEGVKIEDKDEVEAKNKTMTIYKRLTGNCEDWIEHVKIYVNGKPVFKYMIEQPFCQRYFTEPEVIRMLQEAGFEDIDFWSCDYSDGSANKLTASVTAEDCAGEEEEFIMTNVFVARAPKSAPEGE